jgi:acylphosphatase
MTIRYLIRGQVQGVGYRNFASRRAHALALAGWTRNLPDGRVEVVAKGEQKSLEALEALLRAGPPYAHVDAVEKSEISDEAVAGKTFDIKY